MTKDKGTFTLNRNGIEQNVNNNKTSAVGKAEPELEINTDRPAGQKIDKLFPKKEVQRMVDQLSQERQVEFYKVLKEAGLREDDHLWVMLYIMGYIKIMYEDLPQVVTNISEVLDDKTKEAAEIFNEIIAESVEDLVVKINERVVYVGETQTLAIKSFEEASNKYLTTTNKVKDDFDILIKQQRDKISLEMRDTLNKEVPKIINEHMKSIASEMRGQNQTSWFYKYFNIAALVSFGFAVGTLIKLWK